MISYKKKVRSKSIHCTQSGDLFKYMNSALITHHKF